jgi:hypothetical protein
MKVRNIAELSKANTIHRGRECFLKNDLARWLIKLKKSKYNAFINPFFIQNSIIEVMKFTLEIDMQEVLFDQIGVELDLYNNVGFKTGLLAG